MMDRPLLLHVGYHKTATTWLQDVLFQPQNGFTQILSHSEIFAHLITPHGLDFDAGATAGLIRDRRMHTGVDVVSLEALCGNPFFGGRESDDYAHRLAASVPEARILFGIREQSRMIASVYMQYLQRGGTASAEQFLQGSDVGGYFGFSPDHFRYDRLVSLYQTLFGARNVLVLPLETIADDQKKAVDLICRFSGHPGLPDWKPVTARGVSYPETAAPLLRRINQFRQGPMNPAPVADLGRVSWTAYRAAGRLARAAFPAGRPISTLARKRFGEPVYGQSNRALEKSLCYPVALTGYAGISDEIHSVAEAIPGS